MDLRLLTLLVSLTVASAVNLNCNQQNYVCDGEEVVCNCTTACSEPIHWWDNQTISFCSRTQLCNGNRPSCEPDTSPPVRVEVINCSSSDTFTSRLSYNASLSTSTTIQIGCSSAAINGTTCSPEGEPLESVTLPVRNCTAPHPPRNLQLKIEGAQCNSSSRNVTITWEAPDFGPSQLQGTNYKLTSTPSEGDSRNKTLPADTTSYDLTVDAGVQYTITVSALSNGRESQNNPKLNFTTLKVVNESTTVRTATIQLKNDFKSNLTISSLSCSGASFTPMSFEPPAVHLRNLTADTMYCYLITYDGNNTAVAGSCNGTFSTTANTTSSPTTEYSGTIIGGVIGGVMGAIIIATIIAWKA